METGDERAEELIARMRSRLEPGAEIVRSGAPASGIARHQFSDPHQRSLCVGTVYQARGNPSAMNSLQLGRDGVLRWRREGKASRRARRQRRPIGVLGPSGKSPLFCNPL